MIRIDYSVNAEVGTVNTTWIGEADDKHSMIGRQTMTIEEWAETYSALNSSHFFRLEEKRNT